MGRCGDEGGAYTDCARAQGVVQHHLGKPKMVRGGGAAATGGSNEAATMVALHGEKSDELRWRMGRKSSGTHDDVVHSARNSLAKEIDRWG